MRCVADKRTSSNCNKNGRERLSEKPRKLDEPDAPVMALSIAKFCAVHGISRELYFKLKRNGLGPREMHVGSRVLISVEAAAAWRRAREAAAAAQDTAQREAITAAAATTTAA
jgi:hypothetical protein